MSTNPAPVIPWVIPTDRDRHDHEGDKRLAFVYNAGSQPMDATYPTEKDYGDLFITVDVSGCLVFEYFVNANEPWNCSTVIYWLETPTIDDAKRMAEMVLAELNTITENVWDSLGFHREVVA